VLLQDRDNLLFAKSTALHSWSSFRARANFNLDQILGARSVFLHSWRKGRSQSVLLVRKLPKPFLDQPIPMNPSRHPDIPVSPAVPALIAASGDGAVNAFMTFFSTVLTKPATRRSYLRGVTDFLTYCEAQGIASVSDITSLHLQAYVRSIASSATHTSVETRLTAIRRFFNGLVERQVLDRSPAEGVKGPGRGYRPRNGEPLGLTQIQALLDGIDASGPIGLRDRAIVAVMAYAFVRVGAVIEMKVSDAISVGEKMLLRVQDGVPGGRLVTCEPAVAGYIRAYIDGCDLARIPDAPLFQSIKRGTGQLSGGPLLQGNICKRICLYATKAGVGGQMNARAIRASGLTGFLDTGGTVKAAASMANHQSTRATRKYIRARRRPS